MKLYSTAVAMFLLVGSAAAFAANSSAPGAGGAGGAGAVNAGIATGEPPVLSLGEKLFGQPVIAGDGIQNARQVDNPADIGNKSSTAQDSPEPVPTIGDVGVQNSK